MSEERREGGCLCGAVRYSLPWPPRWLVTCSCSNCQKQSGSALSVVGMIARDDLALTGELATYTDTADTGNAVFRRFCPRCGSPVLTDTDQAREQGIIFFKAGTLDVTRDLEPATHMWTKSAQGWVAFPGHHEQLLEQ
ncbi:MAG: GFA family protein [Novosphingobium sp.]|nr:GFA family protein [Novosphingobium sp.]